jgi:hypothetical protein
MPAFSSQTQCNLTPPATYLDQSRHSLDCSPSSQFDKIYLETLVQVANQLGHLTQPLAGGSDVRHLRRPVTGADLHGAPDLVRAPQRLTCDTVPVSEGRMGLSFNFGLLPASGLRDLQFRSPPGRQREYGRA